LSVLNTWYKSSSCNGSPVARDQRARGTRVSMRHSRSLNAREDCMHTNKPGRLVILSGPSCAGRVLSRQPWPSSIHKLWSWLQKLVLFNSRAPRPEERDGINFQLRQAEPG